MWLARPPGYRELGLLGLCANFDVREREGRWTVLIQEHRMAIPVIWAAMKDGVFREPPLLVRLDAHTDFAEEGIDYAQQLARIGNLEDCILFANSLDNQDGGWVEAIVKFGWVRDVLTAHVQQHPTEDVYHEVQGVNRVRHRLGWVRGGIVDALEGATPSDDRTKRLFEEAARIALDRNGAGQPLWIDIDLDCATYDALHTPIRPWAPATFEHRLARTVTFEGREVSEGEIIEALLERATLVTIATEPDHCGGFAGVASILAGLNSSLSPGRNVFRWFE